MGRHRTNRRARGFDSGAVTRTEKGPPLSPRRLMVRFCLLFLLLVLIFAVLTSTPSAQVMLHAPLSRLLVLISASILGAFGTVSASGNYLSLNGFGVSIVEACNGVLPTYLYVAAVLALPSRWRDKGWGVLIGVPAIFLINLIRVITLMLCGAYWPTVFEQVHIYVWQALVIGLSMAVWVFWAERFARRGHQVGS